MVIWYISYLLVCGLNIVGWLSSMDEKKSIASLSSPTLEVSAFGVTLDDDASVGLPLTVAMSDFINKLLLKYSINIRYSPDLVCFPLVDDFDPPSVAALLVLYSIRFCSKFASSRYS